MKTEYKMALGYIAFLLIILFVISCDGGWSVAGWDVKKIHTRE